MPSILDKLRTALRRPTSSTEQLAAALADARQAEADARHAVERQVEVVGLGYLDAAEKRAKARATLADLRADAEDAALLLAEAERQYGAAVAADADAARRVAYDDAKAKADAAAADLAKLYPRLAFDLVALLGRVAMAQQAAAAVNADLPIGFGPIADPEMVARGAADLPREVLNEREEVLWVHDWERDPIRPAAPELQSQIHEVRGGWGMGPSIRGGGLSNGTTPFFRRHRLRRREVHPAVSAQPLMPLAATLNLPALRGSQPLWEAEMHWRTFDPEDVAARVAAVEEAEVAAVAPISRAVRVEWEDLGETNPQPLVMPDPSDTTKRAPPLGSRFAASPFAAPGSRPARR